MKATKIELVHFRSARQLTLNFESGMNLLVGVNGAGKSTILDSMAIALSWATARLRSTSAGGRRILETDIHNEKNFSWIELTCQPSAPEDKPVFWRLMQTRQGRNPDVKNDPLNELTFLKGIRTWGSLQRDRIGQADGKVNLPLLVYYPVNRAVLDIPLRIRKAHTFDLFDAYDGSLISGANFRSFFEWYRDREDLENEYFRESRKLREDRQLKAVKTAILKFLPEFTEISVKRKPLRMEVTKNGDKLRVDQMSDGEKCLFAMVGDLSRRLAIANPALENPLNGTGIVLIDEIELHLHPAWQRSIVSNLRNTFPNCQFIISTHSPQVFGEVDAECVRRLAVDSLHGLTATIPNQALGLDSSEILEELMEAKSRNEQVTDDLSKIFKLIDNDQFEDAKCQIKELSNKLRGDIPELLRAQTLITMLEPDESMENASN